MNYCSIQDAWGSQFNEINLILKKLMLSSVMMTLIMKIQVGGTNHCTFNSYRNKLQELKEKKKIELYKKIS